MSNSFDSTPGRQVPKPFRLAMLTSVVAISAGAFTPALAQDAPAKPKALKVCQDPNNMPFSNEKAEGFENRIADLFAKSMGVPVEYFNYPQRFAFVRSTLRYKVPGQDYPCDIMLGVPKGFGQVAGTQAYYRSTYAMVFPKGKGLDEVKSADDFLKLDPAKLKSLRIGIYDKSPASAWLDAHGLVDQGVPYPTVDVNRDHYPGWLIDQELANGKVDVAIVWGPVAAHYADKLKTAELIVVPMKSEPGVKFDFEIAMGVRHGEPEWKSQVETLIEQNKDEIQAILHSYHVPLIDDKLEVISN